jgi:hypothetical protein
LMCLSRSLERSEGVFVCDAGGGFAFAVLVGLLVFSRASA